MQKAVVGLVLIFDVSECKTITKNDLLIINTNPLCRTT